MKIFQKFSKNMKSFQKYENFPKIWKVSENLKLGRSCLLITLITCLEGHKSLRVLFGSVFSKVSMSQSVREFSCLGTAKHITGGKYIRGIWGPYLAYPNKKCLSAEKNMSHHNDLCFSPEFWGIVGYAPMRRDSISSSLTSIPTNKQIVKCLVEYSLVIKVVFWASLGTFQKHEIYSHPFVLSLRACVWLGCKLHPKWTFNIFDPVRHLLSSGGGDTREQCVYLGLSRLAVST